MANKKKHGKRFSEEKIVCILKELDEGKTITELSRTHGVSDQTIRTRRRGYIMARMVSNFLSALGGESDGAPIPPPPPPPRLKVGGHGGFWPYNEDLYPGNILEDLVRAARWHSMHSGTNS